jgi:hypothetical protein
VVSADAGPNDAPSSAASRTAAAHFLVDASLNAMISLPVFLPGAPPGPARPIGLVKGYGSERFYLMSNDSY